MIPDHTWYFFNPSMVFWTSLWYSFELVCGISFRLVCGISFRLVCGILFKVAYCNYFFIYTRISFRLVCGILFKLAYGISFFYIPVLAAPMTQKNNPCFTFLVWGSYCAICPSAPHSASSFPTYLWYRGINPTVDYLCVLFLYPTAMNDILTYNKYPAF